MPSAQPSPGLSFLDSMSITHHLAALTVRSILSAITRREEYTTRLVCVLSSSSFSYCYHSPKLINKC